MTGPTNRAGAQPDRPGAANVKLSANTRSRPGHYERFGQTIRYLTIDELRRFLDGITDLRHRLMMRTIYELGCRVGEFVRIRLEHVDFARGTVLFPAEHTKTRQRRVAHLPAGLAAELVGWLRSHGRMARRSLSTKRSWEFLFHPPSSPVRPYSENRLRQIFSRWAAAAGLERVYGRDTRGRRLRELTIHSLRHSHIMHYVHTHGLPLPIVQRQVGHRTLRATSVYLRPSDEHVGEAYARARHHPRPMNPEPQSL